MDKQKVEILLIEDNPHEAALIIRSLKKHHLTNKLLHLEDGAEALDYIFSEEKADAHGFAPKLILLDLKLPKVGGLEILRQLKAGERTRQIPVVILTSSREENDIIESYKLGVNSYIVKPVNFESFSKAVSDAGLYWVILNQPVP